MAILLEAHDVAVKPQCGDTPLLSWLLWVRSHTGSPVLRGMVVNDVMEAAGARRTRCRRVPEERTVLCVPHRQRSTIREEFVRLVSLLCSGVLVAWSGTLRVALYHFEQ